MKFRLAVHPKPREHKSIVPSHLLSDPAFSPDPHLNPYFAADQQLAWAPPQGHPVLKNKNKGPVANFALRNDIIASADFDFQLLQPPNSPVSILGGSGTQEPSSFPFLSTLKSGAASDSPVLNAIAPTVPIASATASTSLHTRSAPVAQPAVSTVSIVPPQPPAAKVVKKTRMPFLTRRKSQAPPPNPPNAPQSSTSIILSSSDVTRPLPPRMVTEPVTAAAPAKRPVFPLRSATTGTDTPRSTGASSLSAVSKRHGSNTRLNDLDRIDELDETNPWGISLHHGGPYEAAVQAIRRGGPGPSSFDSNTTSVKEFHTQYGQPYVPPQAPPGVSLNLSPGQILPRNFGEHRPSHPRPRDTSALPPRMQQAHPQPHPALSRSQSHASSSQTSLIPPRHMNRMKPPPEGQPEPLRYRRQSQPVLPVSSTFSAQFPNPHELHPDPRHDTDSDLTFSRRQSQTYQQPPLVLNTNPMVSPDPQSHPAPSNLSHQPIQDFHKDSQNAPDISRRQSQASSSSFTLLNSPSQPPSVLRSESSEESRIERPENASDQPSDEAMSFNIGMAMFEPEEVHEPSEVSISTPRIFLPPGTPDDEQDFDPYDPVHLSNEHPRTPSPLIVLYARSSHSHESSSSRKSYASRIPSPDHSIEAAHPEPTKAIRASEMAVGQQEIAISSMERRGIDPPPYDLVALDGPTIAPVPDRVSLHRQSSHMRSPAQTSTSSRNASPAPSKKSTLSVPSEGSHHSRRERPMSQFITMHDGPAAVQSQRYTPNDLSELQGKSRPISMHDNVVRNARPIVTQEQPNGSSVAQAFVPSTPPTHSRERLVSPPPSNYAKSTHPSISTYSSSQARNGPPPANRHLPKRLVMPAPLNTMNAQNNNNGNGLNGLTSPPIRLNPLPQTYTPPRQIPPRQAQAAFQPQTQVYRPPVHPLASKPHMPIIQPAQEIHTGAVRKLKKRASVMPPASAVHIPPAPVISTVSFAPPVIGYGQNASVDKALSRAKTDKIPKRVLSKRRTDF